MDNLSDIIKQQKYACEICNSVLTDSEIECMLLLVKIFPEMANEPPICGKCLKEKNKEDGYEVHGGRNGPDDEAETALDIMVREAQDMGFYD